MRLILALVLVLSASAAHAQEFLTLTVPIPKPSITNYRVDELRVMKLAGRLVLWLKASNGERVEIEWNADGLLVNGVLVVAEVNKGPNLIKLIVKANFTMNSLEKRLYNQLIAEGGFAGSVTGMPE